MGLKLEEIKKIKATSEIIEKHYPNNQDWLKSVGKKTIDVYKKCNLNIVDDIGTDDDLEIGKLVRKWLIKNLTSEPVVVLILSGNYAIEIVRKIVGDTVPIFAELGSIRGDFSIDSVNLSSKEKRALQNLVHASTTVEEAEREISIWF